MLDFSPERGMAAMFLCDEHGLYGSKLYELWNDVCKRDPEMLIGIIEGLESNVVLELIISEKEEKEIKGKEANVEDILKEIERIATKMAWSANMGHESVEELMIGLNGNNLTKKQALDILNVMQQIEKTIN